MTCRSYLLRSIPVVLAVSALVGALGLCAPFATLWCVLGGCR